MKKIASIVILLTVFISSGWTEKAKANAFSEFPEALGFYYGMISGTGLTYHRWDNNRGYQITAGALYLPPEAGNMNILDYVVGFENQYVVYSEDFTGWLSGLLSLFWGINHRGYIPVEYNYDTDTSTIGSYVPTFTLGGGIGIEVLGFKHFSFPFEVGYGATYLPLADRVADMFLVDLYFQAGFRYRY
ncbi:MAG: hypothetical protein JW760_15415 [Spirochaetales bacterium]|nr:hypothetical protein [Spirochaetales bacterium]